MTHQRTSATVAAVDLGATSGRVIVGHVDGNELSLHEVSRFSNGPVQRADGLHWDIETLYGHALSGLAAAIHEYPAIASIGIDSWAVDYALMRDGQMVAEPFHYRDTRTTVGVEKVHALVSPAELYASNGLQFLPFNTLYQFAAEKYLTDVDSFLLVPDLFAFWLTGRQVAERTNASTTGMLSVVTGEWDDALIKRLGYSRSLFPPLVDPGAILGSLRPDVSAIVGGGIEVVAVGSHDTASAVLAVPAASGDFAYISCGTWGLVGVELENPILTESSRAANFTNERGADGTFRFLQNVMGLWLLSECVREWDNEDLAGLLAKAALVSGPISVFNANDPRFSHPGKMQARIAAWLREHDQRVPASPAEYVRSIIESLAVAFAAAVRMAMVLSGKTVSTIHIVGGGALNELLCQRTADHAGLPVLAGPVEATAIGNVLIQARTHTSTPHSLDSLRSLVAAASPITRYGPRER